MRLAKVTLSGFKSFADTTEFRFDSPITGIVGPNGCGKSNVVDAIKWVLGERSAKSLRGDAMLDVIFAGSAARKPMGAATVTLTFDNPVIRPDAPTAAEQRFLAVDTEQVDVGRRLYRDGRSEYLINQKKCRLRDIKELFMDTGIGTHAYSIIEQGRVDAMLMANPVERRAILEEAAGVAKFRARKVEAQRKLERTEVNLVRVREQLANTERRLRIVKGQAAKARRFQELDERYRELRTALALDIYHELQEQLHGLTSRLTALDRERAGLMETLRGLEDDKQQADLARHDVEDEQRSLEQHKLEAIASRKHASQRREMTLRNLRDAEGHVAEDRARLEELDERVKSLDRQLAQADEAIVAAADRLANCEQTVETLQIDRAGAQRVHLEVRQEAESQRQALNRLEQTQADLAARSRTLDHREQDVSEQVQRTTDHAAQLSTERDNCQQTLDEAERVVTDTQEAAEELGRRVSEHDAQIAALGASASDLASSLSEQRHARAAIESRRCLLEEMQTSHEGLTDAVKAVLDQPAVFPEVRSLLGDVINTDQEHAALVEAALGHTLEALLVPTEADAVRVSERLADVGRVTMLSLEQDEAPPALPLAAPARPLIDLISVDEAFRPAVTRLLAQTVLVWDLTTAQQLARTTLPGWRLVTRRGDVVEADGRVVTGPRSNGAAGDGWLSRRLELARLQEQVVERDERIAALSEELGAINARSEAEHARQEAIAQDLDQKRQQLVEAQYAAERCQTDLQRLERQEAAAEQERHELQQRLSALRDERTRLEAQRADVSTQLDEQHQSLAEAERALAQAEAAIESVQEGLAAARVDLGQAGEQLEASRRERRHVQQAQEESARQREICRQQVHRHLSQIEQYEAAVADADREITEASSVVERIEAESSGLDARLRQAEQDVVEAAERLSDARQQANRLDRDYHAVEISRREVEVKREGLEDRTLEDLELDLNIAYIPYRAQLEEEPQTPIDRDSAEQEIGDLRTAIKKLGNVNIDAIEEETLLEDRNEDLIRQVEDIDSARAQLEGLIGSLESASRQRFEDTFNMIRENFAGPQGMFRRLFGGGSADIMLLPDEEGNIDWLESGVEIRAKPPGKEPRVISQLSGGEKTMTAVALLMAIFKSKPSPFCILDEVDAALDDANVDRFCRILEPFIGDSHFIIITHHKHTMGECDQLYGVTMQERGVSKRVAVQVDEVGADGKLSKAAMQRAARQEPVEDARLNGESQEAAPVIETKPASALREQLTRAFEPAEA